MEQNKQIVFTSPRNFKYGRLIMNRFRLSDLIIVIAGVVFSFLGLIIYVGFLSQFNIWIVLLLLLPAVITYFLTLPAGIYHNNIEFLKVIVRYVMTNKKYIWEGIYKHDSIEEK
ncbi:hypothetical protein [Solobacterium moorei]|uniref:hypothetical protein n=1 Tax=Solobacterium moorei TaxID=102148 RepID=UPI00068547B3|nr:hypothetical protein [Solobacterium moorei]BET21938.1 hypothetical protein RGT18_15260 [Solobacterium moorei]BET22755.1 hypothetical protein RGT18_23430 [Solobacterium moorei]